jgi:hypothetical protein
MAVRISRARVCFAEGRRASDAYPIPKAAMTAAKKATMNTISGFMS